mgnify:CR=1 FL=1|tara:strand:+ start:10941 stop:13076 length:2136 start_codon:yes stop_codon:yes gene_type:complete
MAKLFDSINYGDLTVTGELSVGLKAKFSENVQIKENSWDAVNLEGNALYTDPNGTNGFAFGNGNSVSTWFSYDGTLRRAINVYNDNSKVEVSTDLEVSGTISGNGSGLTSITATQVGAFYKGGTTFSGRYSIGTVIDDNRIYTHSGIEYEGSTKSLYVTGNYHGDNLYLSGAIQGSNDRLSFLKGNGALPINTNELLVSSSYSDSSKVPTNGLYVKGSIKTDGDLNVSGNISGNGSGLTGTASLRATGTTKADVGLGNVPNVDATNAGNISSGTLSSSRLPTITTSMVNFANQSLNTNSNVDFNQVSSTQYVGNGTEIKIGAGESMSSMGGFGGEIVHIAGENGVKVYASSDNLSSGLNRVTTLIDTNGNANFGGSITATSFSGSGSGLTGTASLRAKGTTKSDVGLGSVDNYSRAHYDSRYLAAGGKAVDADKLDGISSSGFIRTSGSQTISTRFRLYDSATSAHVNWDARDDGTTATIHKFRNSSSGYSFYRENWYDGSSYHPIEMKSDGLYTDGSKVWHAGNFNPSSKANTSGTYSGLRAQATTKSDVGLSFVDNYSRAHYDARYLNESSNLADLPDKSTARSNLGLSDAATTSVSSIRSGTTKSDVGLSSVRNVSCYSKSESDERYSARKPNANAVGSYMLAHVAYVDGGPTYRPGDTISGSKLDASSVNSFEARDKISLPGTWRCMGWANADWNASESTTLFVRIA